MGIDVQNIGGIMGKTTNKNAINLFNFGGSYTKFFFLIRNGTYRPGDYSDIGEGRFEENNGTRSYLKPSTIFNTLADGNGDFKFGGYPDLGGTGPSTQGYSHNYAHDIYAIVKPDRTVNEYIQVDSGENVVTAQTHFKNAIDIFLP